MTSLNAVELEAVFLSLKMAISIAIRVFHIIVHPGFKNYSKKVGIHYDWIEYAEQDIAKFAWEFVDHLNIFLN